MEKLTLSGPLSQEIFNETQKYTNLLTRPYQFNMREMIRGMILSGSTYLNHIGKANGTNGTERKTIERLSRTLEKLPTEKFAKIHVQNQAHFYKNEAILILSDGGDFQKPYAKKMDMVNKAIDGSNGHKVGIGYPLHSLMALGLDSGNLDTLALRVYSTLEEGFKGVFDEEKKNFELLRPLIMGSTRDRIIVEDRGCDDEKRFLYFVNDLKSSFVTRLHTGEKSRIVMVRDEEGDYKKYSIQDLAKKLKPRAKDERTWWNNKIKKKLKSNIAFETVYLPDHPGIRLFAIFCYSEGYEQPLVVLTDLKTDSGIKAWKHFFYYKKRWEVENFYRAIKQNFSAEKFLILDFNKIKALTFLVMVAFSLILRIKRKAKEFLGMLAMVFKSFCKKTQRSGKHHLDLLAFIRDHFATFEPSFYYRFYAARLRENLSRINKKQLKLFNPNKIW